MIDFVPTQSSLHYARKSLEDVQAYAAAEMANAAGRHNALRVLADVITLADTCLHRLDQAGNIIDRHFQQLEANFKAGGKP